MYKAFLFLSILLVGCSNNVEDFFDNLSGRERQTVVLVKNATTIASDPLPLKSTEPMKILGKEFAVCVVLRQEIPLAHQSQMDKYFQEALGDAKLSAILRVKNGPEFDLKNAGFSWKQRGVISSTGELSACLSCGCGPKPSVGADILEISLKSSRPLRVLGIYWESNNDFDKKNN